MGKSMLRLSPTIQSGKFAKAAKSSSFAEESPTESLPGISGFPSLRVQPAYLNSENDGRRLDRFWRYETSRGCVAGRFLSCSLHGAAGKSQAPESCWEFGVPAALGEEQPVCP